MAILLAFEAYAHYWLHARALTRYDHGPIGIHGALSLMMALVKAHVTCDYAMMRRLIDPGIGLKCALSRSIGKGVVSFPEPPSLRVRVQFRVVIIRCILRSRSVIMTRLGTFLSFKVFPLSAYKVLR